MNHRQGFRLALLSAAAALSCGVSHAADWSDTYLTYHYGANFREPYISDDIHKSIVSLTSVSGYSYGTNFFNLDMLMSDSKDPAGNGSGNGAQEAYIVYRNTVDLQKVTGKSFAFGPARDTGVTFGFDWNTKNDAGYNSKKQMLVLGPTLMLNVPGFLDVSLLELWESNAPYNTFTNTSTPRYMYAPHPMLAAAWGIPFTVGSIPLSFEGFVNVFAPKGTDEFGNQTAQETNFDGSIMYDLGATLGSKPKTFKVGFEYQWWKNKFGNNSDTVTGAFAQTPMLRAEYHF